MQNQVQNSKLFEGRQLRYCRAIMDALDAGHGTDYEALQKSFQNLKRKAELFAQIDGTIEGYRSIQNRTKEVIETAIMRFTETS